MSRFDIFFILTDECNTTVDKALASSIVKQHKTCHQKSIEINKPEGKLNNLNPSSLLRYLKFAKYINPRITPSAGKLLGKVYQRMRISEFSLQKSAYKITVRQLESLIRLSEACARLHCCVEVTVDHVKEAVGLLQKSIIRIEAHDIELNFNESNSDK